jgi:adenylate cyclase class 2
MALEIEAKFKVDSFEAVRRRLTELRGERICAVLESNHIFDTQDRGLFARGCGLRIRTCAGQGRVPASTLTYKGPQTQSSLKSREELETHIDDADAARGILAGLGFTPVLVFEKRREKWRLSDCTIELDELPRLGCYVEIEGPTEQAVTSAQASLNLAHEQAITTTYIALLIEHARANHLPADHITF